MILLNSKKSIKNRLLHLSSVNLFSLKAWNMSNDYKWIIKCFPPLQNIQWLKNVLCLQRITPHNNKFTTNGYYFFYSCTFIIQGTVYRGGGCNERLCQQCRPFPHSLHHSIGAANNEEITTLPWCYNSIQMKPRPKHHRQKIKTTEDKTLHIQSKKWCSICRLTNKPLASICLQMASNTHLIPPHSIRLSCKLRVHSRNMLAIPFRAT